MITVVLVEERINVGVHPSFDVAPVVLLPDLLAGARGVGSCPVPLVCWLDEPVMLDIPVAVIVLQPICLAELIKVRIDVKVRA